MLNFIILTFTQATFLVINSIVRALSWPSKHYVQFSYIRTNSVVKMLFDNTNFANNLCKVVPQLTTVLPSLSDFRKDTNRQKAQDISRKRDINKILNNASNKFRLTCKLNSVLMKDFRTVATTEQATWPSKILEKWEYSLDY